MTLSTRPSPHVRAGVKNGRHVLGSRSQSNVGIAQLPGFAESLRLLIEREQYSLTDIALMFGVSRERMRQLVERAGLSASTKAYPLGLNAIRAWDDATHRFYPCARGQQRKRADALRKAQRAANRARDLAARRAHVGRMYHQLHATLGMAPTVAQWTSAVYGREMPPEQAAIRLCAYWGADPGNCRISRKGRLAEIRCAVGAPSARRGVKSSALYCYKGHPMFGAALAWTQGSGRKAMRYCRQCRRDRDRAKRARPPQQAPRAPRVSA